MDFLARCNSNEGRFLYRNWFQEKHTVIIQKWSRLPILQILAHIIPVPWASAPSDGVGCWGKNRLFRSWRRYHGGGVPQHLWCIPKSTRQYFSYFIFFYFYGIMRPLNIKIMIYSWLMINRSSWGYGYAFPRHRAETTQFCFNGHRREGTLGAIWLRN